MIHWCLNTALNTVLFLPVAERPHTLITVELLLHVNLRFPEANELHGLPLKVSPATLEDQDGVQYAYFLFGAMVSACLGACVHSATGRSTTTTYEYYHHDHDGCDDDNNKELMKRRI